MTSADLAREALRAILGFCCGLDALAVAFPFAVGAVLLGFDLGTKAEEHNECKSLLFFLREGGASCDL